MLAVLSKNGAQTYSITLAYQKKEQSIEWKHKKRKKRTETGYSIQFKAIAFS